MGDSTESPNLQTSQSRKLPSREDFWSEEPTRTLIDAWGRRYLELNRGNLRQKDWREVADTVNELHGQTKRTHRTDVQCKNRIDTLKKKYKTEKTKTTGSNGSATSSWPFFSRLEYLIGPNLNKGQNQKLTPSSTALALSESSPPMALPLPYRKLSTSAIATALNLPSKRSMASPPVDESYFRRNFSVMAAAAAAADATDADSDGTESEGSEDGDEEVQNEEEDGMTRLVKAIDRFGEIYEKVECMKQKQMVELEKQRMQFTKDLEVQRMQLFMDTQVQLEKTKKAKRSGSSDGMQHQLMFSRQISFFSN